MGGKNDAKKRAHIIQSPTYSKFARKINFLALGVYCPAGQSAFRRARPQMKLGEEIESSILKERLISQNFQIPNPTLILIYFEVRLGPDP